MFLEINTTHEILLALGFTAAFGFMFFLSELIYSKTKVDAEVTRKFIHISCGTIAMLVPYFKPHIFTMVTLGILFSMLTYYMMRKGLLPSVNSVKRHTIGSVLYPLGIICCAIFGMKDDYRLYFFIPLSTLIYSDTVAALIGLNFPIKKFSVMGFTKSIGGSIGFFISALIISIGFCIYFLPEANTSRLIMFSVVFALGTTFIEMMSVDGWDDVTVPLASFMILLAGGVYG